LIAQRDLRRNLRPELRAVAPQIRKDGAGRRDRRLGLRDLRRSSDVPENESRGDRRNDQDDSYHAQRVNLHGPERPV
jgi:hypothetical protein